MAYLLGAPVAMPDVLAVLQPLEYLFYRRLRFSRLFLLQTLATLAGDPLLGLESLLHELNVLEPQLLGNNLQITNRIDVALDMDDLGIVKATHDLEDGIDGTNVGQEGVTQTGTSRSTAGQACDIVDSQVGGNSGFWRELVAEPVIPLVGDDNAGFLGFDGSIGKVGWVAQMAFRDGLEQGGFSDVCKADLKESQRAACTCARSGFWAEGFQELTIPLFRLLPGRPSRIFSGSACFLGGIFFFLE